MIPYWTLCPLFPRLFVRETTEFFYW
jgi:hypothetical protein